MQEHKFAQQQKKLHWTFKLTTKRNEVAATDIIKSPGLNKGQSEEDLEAQADELGADDSEADDGDAKFDKVPAFGVGGFADNDDTSETDDIDDGEDKEDKMDTEDANDDVDLSKRAVDELDDGVDEGADQDEEPE